MAKKGKIDIKFVFVSILAQKLWSNPFQAATILDLSGSGALAKSFQYALSCIRAKFGACR